MGEWNFVKPNILGYNITMISYQYHNLCVTLLLI